MTRVILLGFGEANGTWTNPQWMANTLQEKGYEVVYINPPAYRRILPKDILRILKRSRFSNNPQQLQGVDVRNSHNADFLPKWVRRLLMRRLVASIGSWDQVICFQPLWLDFFPLDFDRDIFFVADDYAAIHVNYAAQHEKNSLVAQKAKKTIVTSPELLSKFPAARVELNCIPKSIPLPSVKKKRNQVCFVGTLNSLKINLDNLAGFIERNSNLHFKFAGKLAGINNLLKIQSLSNFEYLGELNYIDARNLMRESEFGLVPFEDNTYTRSMFSMKYFEYLSEGCSVLTTKLQMYSGLPKDLRPREYICLSDYLGEEPIVYRWSSTALRNAQQSIFATYTYATRIERLVKLGWLNAAHTK